MNTNLIKTFNKLPNKNGRCFGYLEFDKKLIFLDHWKEQKKNYTQWKFKDPDDITRFIGAANVSDEPINVQKSRRDKYLKETILNIFPDLDIEKVEFFLSEIVNVANQLDNNLFPDEIEPEEKAEVFEVNGFEDYNDDIKAEAEAIFDEDPLEYFLKILDLVHYGDAENKEILILVLFAKHIANAKPVSVIIVGTTESGKTSLANKTSKITPPRFLIETNSMSSKAAFYHQDSFREDYNHLIINDFLDSEEAIGTLKALTDTEIDKPKHMTVSDDKKAITLEVKGKNTVIVTAARQLTDRELNRRLLHLNPDESEEHQEKTKEFIVKEEAGITKKHHKKFELAHAIYDKIINKNYEVFVPWVIGLNTTLLSKTDIKHFTNLVKARTLIHQANRVEILDNVLLASLEDFQKVAELWNHIGEIQTTYLPAKAFEMLKILPKWDHKGISGKEHYGKKINEIALELGVNRTAVKRWLWGQEDQRGMIDLGYIYAIKDGDTNTSPWILYQNSNKRFYDVNEENKTLKLDHYQLFKGFQTPKSKRKVILALSNLYERKGYLTKTNSEDLTEIICHNFNHNIETNQDILKISEIIKEKL